MAWWMILLITYGSIVTALLIAVLIVFAIVVNDMRKNNIKRLRDAISCITARLHSLLNWCERKNELDELLSNELDINLENIELLTKRIDLLEEKINKNLNKHVDKA